MHYGYNSLKTVSVEKKKQNEKDRRCLCLYLVLVLVGQRQAEGALVSQTGRYSEAKHVG